MRGLNKQNKHIFAISIVLILSVSLFGMSGCDDSHTVEKDVTLPDPGVTKVDPHFIDEPTEELEETTEVDETKCDDITDPESRGDCFNWLAKKVNNPEYCAGANQLKDDCYKYFAVIFEEPQYCEQAGESASICYNKLGIIKDDASLCDKATETQDRELCNYQVGIDLQDAELCKKSGSAEDECTIEVARLTNDEGVCSLLTDKANQRCIKAIVIATGDYRRCLDLDLSKSGCLEQTALEIGDSAPCALIDDARDGEHEQAHCYFKLGKQLEDASLCDKAGIYSDDCYNSVALRTHDKSLCEKAGAKRQACIDWFEQADNLPESSQAAQNA